MCPGAGFALLGRAKLAVSAFLTSLALLGAIAWLMVRPGPAALWACLALFVPTIVLWLVEQFVIKRSVAQPSKPKFLVGGFLLATAAVWLASAFIVLLFSTRFGSLQVAGPGMAPTISKGERLLYAKRIVPERLRRGMVILFRVSDRSAWRKPGSLAISRILGVPGDRLSIREGAYLVNGKVAAEVGVTGQYKPVVEIPIAPETLIVPEGRFFIVQDLPSGGFDSRVLSWVETDDVVSSQLYRLNARRFLNEVQ